MKRKLSAMVLTAVLWPAAANSAPLLYARGGDTAQRLLAAHNAERARVRVAPLQWDPQLAASAATYGPMLASVGRLQHWIALSLDALKRKRALRFLEVGRFRHRSVSATQPA